MKQFEIWKGRPPDFKVDHWFVVISGQERIDDSRAIYVNGLACYTLRVAPRGHDVILDSADGLSAATACQCDYLHPLEKRSVHSSLGQVSWERQQQIKSKIKLLLRL